MNPFETPRPRLFAHRGASAVAPENTLAAFEEAVRLGADVLELDLHATRDGTLMVLHDATVDRTTDGRGALASMAFDRARELDAGFRFVGRDGGHKYRGRGIVLPTFDEVLSTFPNTPLNVDLKSSVDVTADPADSVAGVPKVERELDPQSPSVERELDPHSPRVERELDPSSATGASDAMRRAFVDALTRHRAMHRVIAASENAGTLRALRRELPGLATGFALQEVIEFLASADRPDYRPPGRALQIPPEHRGRPLVTRELVQAAHSRGIEVHVWTIDDEAEMGRLLDLGVDGVMTNDPAMAMSVLRSRGLR